MHSACCGSVITVFDVSVLLNSGEVTALHDNMNLSAGATCSVWLTPVPSYSLNQLTP
jgi:hypothetical protein